MRSVTEERPSRGRLVLLLTLAVFVLAPMTPAQAAPSPIVATEATPGGDGYWLMDERGRVFAFGAAARLGNVSEDPDDPTSGCCRGLVATRTGQGLWSVTFGGPGVGGQVKRRGDAPNVGNFASE